MCSEPGPHRSVRIRGVHHFRDPDTTRYFDVERPPRKGRTEYVKALRAEMSKIRRARKKGVSHARRAVEEADARMKDLHERRDA